MNRMNINFIKLCYQERNLLKISILTIVVIQIVDNNITETVEKQA